MQKLLLTIVILILVVWGISVATNSNEAPEQQEEDTSGEMTKQSLAGSGTYEVAPSESSFAWRGETVAGTVEIGTVLIESGELSLASSTLAGGSFVINLESITSPVGAVANHLKNEDFFNVEEYPTALFEITSVAPIVQATTSATTSAPLATHQITGNLTIKDITEEISFPAEVYMDEEGVLYADAMFEVDRTRFDITFRSGDFFADLGDKTIRNEFMVDISIVAHDTTLADLVNEDAESQSDL